MSPAFLFEALRKQVKSDAINPRDSFNLLSRQPGFHSLATRIGEEFRARAFINVKLGEKSLKAGCAHAAASSSDLGLLDESGQNAPHVRRERVDEFGFDARELYF